MEDLVKQMMVQTQMLQEALAKQAQEPRDREERAEAKAVAKAREERERAETKAREDRERFEAQLREERERAEERFAALLASRSGTVPVQSGEQLLISNLSLRIEIFNYSPEEDLDFQAWYKRYGALFEEDGKDVSDAAKARLLVQKLGSVEHHKFLDSIKPKELSFEATVKQLQSLFAPAVSKVMRQYQCFQVKQVAGEDKISFASKVNSLWESCFSTNVNLSTLKCVSFVAGLADSECDAKMRCVRVLEMAEADNRVVTLDELKEECKKIDVFNQGMIGLSNAGQPLNVYAVKAQKSKLPRQEAHRYGRKQSTDSSDMEAGHVTGKKFYGDSSHKLSSFPKYQVQCFCCGKNHFKRNCPNANIVCAKCNCVGHFAKMCKSKGGNNVNIGRININETGSAHNFNSGAYGADKKISEWELKLPSMSVAQAKKMNKLMYRTGCTNEDAIYTLERNDYHLGNAESEIKAYGGGAALKEAGEEREANQPRVKQIWIRSTQLVEKASENSSNKSHKSISISKLSTGISKPKSKSSIGCSKQNMERCSRFNQGARVYFQKWTPGVVVALKAGGEYDVSEVKGQCMSASFQCINEGALINLTANQLRNRNAMSASEEKDNADRVNAEVTVEESACRSPIRCEKTDRSQKLRRNARGKARKKTASKKCAAPNEPLDSPSKSVSLDKVKKLEERSVLDKASDQPLSQGSMSQQA